MEAATEIEVKQDGERGIFHRQALYLDSTTDAKKRQVEARIVTESPKTLEALEAERDRAREGYADLAEKCKEAYDYYSELVWLLATGIEHQQLPTVTDALTKIARADELNKIPWKSGLSDFLPILRKFYLDGAAESDRARTVKALEKNLVYKVARRNEYHQYLTDAIPETALDAADVEQTFRRFLTAYQWVETNRERIEAARLKWKEAKEALSAAKREAEEKADIERIGHQLIEAAANVVKKSEAALDAAKKYDRLEKRLIGRAAALGVDLNAIDAATAKYSTAARTADRRGSSKSGSSRDETDAPAVEPKRYGGQQTTLLDGQYKGRTW